VSFGETQVVVTERLWRNIYTYEKIDICLGLIYLFCRVHLYVVRDAMHFQTLELNSRQDGLEFV
jgi:hypothetical protein